MQVQVIRREGRDAIAVQCNVQSDAAQEAALKCHLAAWGCLNIAILNAGIFEKGVDVIKTVLASCLLECMHKTKSAYPTVHAHSFVGSCGCRNCSL